MIERAIAMLEEQQSKVQARSPQWMVGEQLKDICRQEPHCAELIAQDLENSAMSITEAEKKIKAFKWKPSSSLGILLWYGPVISMVGHAESMCGKAQLTNTW